MRKIWIDDIRTPPNSDWIWCKNYDEFVKAFDDEFPDYISFDHDLGIDENGKLLKTGFDCAKYLKEYLLDLYYNDIEIKDFDYFVHSANPVGALNIERLLNSLLNFIEKR
jgi:hypothetical protein